MSTALHPGPSGTRHPAALVVGLLVGVAALGQLVPLLLSTLVASDLPWWAGPANLVLFGAPLALLLLAAVGLVRHGVGRPTAPPALPTSRTGWAACVLALASVGSLLVMGVAAYVQRDELPATSFFDPLWLAVPLLLAGALAAVSLVAGLVAVVRRDRASAVLAAVAVTWFFVTFGAGELLFDH